MKGDSPLVNCGHQVLTASPVKSTPACLWRDTCIPLMMVWHAVVGVEMILWHLVIDWTREQESGAGLTHWNRGDIIMWCGEEALVTLSLWEDTTMKLEQQQRCWRMMEAQTSASILHMTLGMLTCWHVFVMINTE